MISIPSMAESDAKITVLLPVSDPKNAPVEAQLRFGPGPDGRALSVPLRLTAGDHGVYSAGAWAVEVWKSILFVYCVSRAQTGGEARLTLNAPVRLEVHRMGRSQSLTRVAVYEQVREIVLGDDIRLDGQGPGASEAPAAQKPSVEMNRRTAAPAAPVAPVAPAAPAAPAVPATMAAPTDGEAERLREENEDLRREVERLRGENARLAEGVLDAALQVADADAANEALAKKKQLVTQRRAELASLASEAEAAARELEELEDEAHTMRQTRDDIARKLEEYQSARVEELAQNELLNIDTEATMTRLNAMREELVWSQDAAALLEHTDIAGELEAARGAIDRAAGALADIVRAREAASAQIENAIVRKKTKEAD